MKTEDTTTTAAPAAPAPKSASGNKKAIRSARTKTSKTARPKTGHGKTKAKPAPKKMTRPTAGKSGARAGTKREGTKKDVVLQLLRRKQGATTAEIAQATNWQNHTIRGFISGNVSRKMGLTVESATNDAGERSYRIAP